MIREEPDMEPEGYAPRVPAKDLIQDFHLTFGHNIGILSPDALKTIENIDVKLRAIDECHSVILDKYAGSEVHKKQCSQLIPEIFSDFTISMYLFSAGLIVPGRLGLRRGLELGVAVIYMWDLPHEY